MLWGSVCASVKQDNETCLWGCGKGPCQGQAAREGWATGLTIMPVFKPSASIPYSQLSAVPITSPLSPPWLWCSWGQFCLCSPVLFVRLSPPQPSPHWCPHQLRRWRRGHTEDPPDRCGGPRSAAHWQSARSSRWSACREPPGPPAPLPAGWFCWEAMASICHRACCWRGTCLSQPRHTAAPSSLRPCRSVQTWDWPHQLLGFRLWIQEKEHNWSWAGPQPSIHHTNKGMSRWVRVRAVWLWIRPLWSLVPGLLIWNKEWSSIICCDFFNLQKLALHTLWHPSGPRDCANTGSEHTHLPGRIECEFFVIPQDSTSLTHTKLITAEKVDGSWEWIPFPLEQRDQNPMAAPRGMTPGRFKGYTGTTLANAEGLEGATGFQKWNCLEERDLGSIQGPGWCGAKAGAHTEIPLEVTS